MFTFKHGKIVHPDYDEASVTQVSKNVVRFEFPDGVVIISKSTDRGFEVQSSHYLLVRDDGTQLIETDKPVENFEDVI